MITDPTGEIKKPVVVLIDDDEGNLLALGIALRKIDCTVATFTSASHALLFLATNEVAVIFLDVKMPIMDGFEAAARIRLMPRFNTTPIIFVTGTEPTDSHVDRMFEAGGTDFIFKPVNLKVISAKASFFVEMFRKTKELEYKTTLLKEGAELEKADLLENSLDVVIGANQNNVVTFWNKNAERIFGWTKAEILGVDMCRIMPERFRSAHIAGMKRFISSGIPKIQNQRIEIVGLRKRGEEFAMELTVSAIKTSAGYNFYSFIRDISDVKRIQEAVKFQAQRLSLITNAIPDIIAYVDKETRYQFANDAYREWFGVEPQAIVGQALKDVIGETYRHAEPNIAAVFAGESPQFQTEIKNAAGKIRKADIKYIPDFGSDGSVRGFVIVGHDITEIEENRVFVQNQFKYLELVLNRVPAAVFLVDPTTGDVKLANKATTQMSGGLTNNISSYSRDHQLIDAEGNVVPLDMFPRNRASRGDLISGLEYTWQTPERSWDFLMFTDLIPSSYGQMPTAMVSFLDITSLKATERSLRLMAVENARLFNEAQALNRLKDEFLANLSHELRTPMNVIHGYAEILKSEGEAVLSDDFKDYVDAIQRNGIALIAIIDDLLDVSSIITGKISYKPGPVKLAETVTQILESLQKTAAAKNVHLKVDVIKAPAQVTADLTRLHQIIWNLVSNAIKFTDSGGQVTVTVNHSQQDWTITVKDTGRGIDPSFLPYVFDRFRQEDASTTRRFGGLGLGLAVVRHLVELHGGSVNAFSEGLGHGATFTAVIPLESPTAASAVQEKKSSSPSQAEAFVQNNELHGIEILLVEDSPDGRTLIAKMLRLAGAKVIEAESAPAAREKLRSSTPSLIISDIGMPEENGIEFIKSLRASGAPKVRDIPAIALSAFVRPEESKAAVTAGFQAHVGKPVSATTLIQAAKSALGKTAPTA